MDPSNALVNAATALPWEAPKVEKTLLPNLPFGRIPFDIGTFRGFPMKGEPSEERLSKHINQYLGRRKPADIIKSYRQRLGYSFKFATAHIGRACDINLDQKLNKQQRNARQLFNILVHSINRQALYAELLMFSSVNGSHTQSPPFILEYEMIRAWLPDFKLPDLQLPVEEKNIEDYILAHQYDDPLQGLQFIFDGIHNICPYYSDHALSYSGVPALHAMSKEQPNLFFLFQIILIQVTRQLAPYIEQLLISLKQWPTYTEDEQMRLTNAIWAAATLIGNHGLVQFALSTEPATSAWFQGVRLTNCTTHQPIDWEEFGYKKPAPAVMELIKDIRQFAFSSYTQFDCIHQMRQRLDEIEAAALENTFHKHTLAREYLQQLADELKDSRPDGQESSLRFVHEILSQGVSQDAIEATIKPLLNLIEQENNFLQIALDHRINHQAMINWIEQLTDHFCNCLNELRTLEKESMEAYTDLLNSIEKSKNVDMPLLEKIKHQQVYADKLNVHIERIKAVFARWVNESPAHDSSWLDTQQEQQSKQAESFGLTPEHPALVQIQNQTAEIQQMSHNLDSLHHQVDTITQELNAKTHEADELKKTLFALQHKPETRDASTMDSTLFKFLGRLPDVLRQADPGSVLQLLVDFLPDRLAVLPGAMDSAATHQNLINTPEMTRRIITLATQGVDLMRNGARLYDVNEIVPGEVACNESDTVMNTARLRKFRQFKTDDGSTIEVFTHIPIDGRTRMYFDFDETQQYRLRVAYVGKHLPNASSPTI